MIKPQQWQYYEYVDYASSAGIRAIPNNSTISALKSIGATIKFIDYFIDNLYNQYIYNSQWQYEWHNLKL